MRLLPTLGLALYPLLSGCASSGATHDAVEVVEADPAVRAPLMGAVAGLAGRWTVLGDAGEDTGTTEFTVTSMGSALREVMFVGAPHEMTNLYTLDGNALHLTHYCGAGNQPHMRATALADGVNLATVEKSWPALREEFLARFRAAPPLAVTESACSWTKPIGALN